MQTHYEASQQFENYAPYIGRFGLCYVLGSLVSLSILSYLWAIGPSSWH